MALKSLQLILFCNEFDHTLNWEDFKLSFAMKEPDFSPYIVQIYFVWSEPNTNHQLHCLVDTIKTFWIGLFLLMNYETRKEKSELGSHFR